MESTFKKEPKNEVDPVCEQLHNDRDKHWGDWNYVVAGGNVSDEVMQKYLDYYRLRGYQGAFDVAHREGPVAKEMYVVEIKHLPEHLQKLINEINNSMHVVDMGEAEQINNPAHGAMRSWHQNDQRFLPILEARNSSVRAAQRTSDTRSNAYQEYVEGNKHLPAKQIKKEVSSAKAQKKVRWQKKGDDNKEKEDANKEKEDAGPEKWTGYVEYTITSWRSTQGRMVYDYYNHLFYVSPGHYGSGDRTRNPFYLIRLDKLD
jgi:hypothetical protein